MCHVQYFYIPSPFKNLPNWLRCGVSISPSFRLSLATGLESAGICLIQECIYTYIYTHIIYIYISCLCDRNLKDPLVFKFVFSSNLLEKRNLSLKNSIFLLVFFCETNLEGISR